MPNASEAIDVSEIMDEARLPKGPIPAYQRSQVAQLMYRL